MTRPALAAERSLAVIDLLAEQPGQRFTLTEIARATGINPASLHALLAVLERRGWLVRHEAHKTYALGPALVAAGLAAVEQHPGIRAAAQVLDDLSRDLDLEVVLTAPAGGDIVVVGRAGHDSAFGEALRIGQRLPLTPPLGTVFLAWSPPPAIDAWLARARPPLSPEEIAEQRRALAAVRDRGCSVALESPARRSLGSAVAGRADTSELGAMLAQLAHAPYQLTTVEADRVYDVSMVAAPVFDQRSAVAAAITATGFAPGQPAAELQRVAEHVRGIATIVTKRSHGRMPG